MAQSADILRQKEHSASAIVDRVFCEMSKGEGPQDIDKWLKELERILDVQR